MSDSQAASTASATPVRRGPALIGGAIWLVALIVLTFIAAGVGVAMAPLLLDGRSLTNLMFQALPLAALAIVATVLLATGAFDLSVGSIIAITSVTIATLAPDLGVGLAAAVAVLVALVIGLFNGLVVGVLRLHPAIITLGTAALLRGIASAMTVMGDIGPRRIEGANEINSGILNWATLILTLVVALGFVYALSRSGYRSSSSETEGQGFASRLWPVALFTLSGLVAGLAGVSITGRVGVGMADLGLGFEVIAIGVALLGGVAVGRGASSQTGLAILGTLLVVAAYSLVSMALILVGGTGNYSQMITGALVLVGAIVSGAYHWVLRRIAAPRA